MSSCCLRNHCATRTIMRDYAACPVHFGCQRSRPAPSNNNIHKHPRLRHCYPWPVHHQFVLGGYYHNSIVYLIYSYMNVITRQTCRSLSDGVESSPLPKPRICPLSETPHYAEPLLQQPCTPMPKSMPETQSSTSKSPRQRRSLR